MKTRTKRTLLQAATAVAAGCTVAVILLPAASIATPAVPTLSIANPAISSIRLR